MNKKQLRQKAKLTYNEYKTKIFVMAMGYSQIYKPDFRDLSVWIRLYLKNTGSCRKWFKEKLFKIVYCQ